MLDLRKLDLRRFEEQAAAGWVDPYSPAAEHAFLGDTSVALDLLDKAIEAGSTNIPLMGVDPMLKSLRGEARFERMLVRVGLK